MIDRKKDEYLDLEKSSMTVAAYEVRFHALSRFPTQLLNTKDDKIYLCVKGLNTDLQVFVFAPNFFRKDIY